MPQGTPSSLCIRAALQRCRTHAPCLTGFRPAIALHHVSLSLVTAPTPSPLHYSSDADFTLVRNFLHDNHYHAPEICERLGVDRLAMFEGLQPRTEAWSHRDALNTLISLFALGESISHEDAATIPANVLTSLRALGLITDLTNERIYAPIALTPVENLYLVSDRWCSPDSTPFTIADDAVYPAITPNTLKFLDTVPLTPCESLADIGTGTGVAALHAASRYAQHAHAYDITQRSAEFTRFNARLNALTNVTVGCGDLYSPAADQTFDRIIAHPPYVPVLTHHWTFHDGGDDGELITRRLIQDLPRYLRPGGLFHCYAMGSDREHPFEQRIRQWLGSSAPEFDVQFIVHNEMPPMQFAVQTVLKHSGPNSDLSRWKSLFDQNHVHNLVFGTITLQRSATQSSVFTIRRQASPRTKRDESQWSMRIERALLAPDITARILSLKPQLSQSVHLKVAHDLLDGEFTPTHYEISTDHPFATALDIPNWAAVFLARCNGQSTTQQLLDALKSEHYLKPQLPPADFATLVASFFSRGLLSAAQFALPSTAEK